MRNYKEKLKNINTIIFDFDGVLTDGKVLVLPDGDQLRSSNVKDGYAIQLAIKKGLNIVILSGGKSPSMEKRFENLKIKDVFIDVSNKIEVYNNYLKEKNNSPDEVLYMGDDIPDYHPMKASALAVCPADAAKEIKDISHYISHLKGGEGCARDIIEQVLKVKGEWFDEDSFVW